MHHVIVAATTVADPFDFLAHRIPDTRAWDALRLITAISTSMLALFYLRIAFGGERPESDAEVVTIRVGIISYLAMLIPAALTELAEYGQAPLPWRLPMVLVANVFGWWYVHRRL